MTTPPEERLERALDQLARGLDTLKAMDASGHFPPGDPMLVIRELQRWHETNVSRLKYLPWAGDRPLPAQLRPAVATAACHPLVRFRECPGR